ncbi:MAG: DNA repair protein RadC [Alphaproteobacteria bacterium]|nr:DNA repair protein RadC [Alphaproteobacteria bacterium]
MAETPDYLGHRQRLREKFLNGGGKSMPDYEFLELLLTIAIPRRDVKPLAKKLVNKYGSFAGVVNAPLEDLLAFEGVKENSATVLKLVKEAAIRLNWQVLNNSDEPVINNWDLLIDYCRSSMGHQEFEEFKIVFLNNKLQVLCEESQQRGTVDQVAIHPREVIKSAVLKGASAIILIHNHPSGNVTPSKADIDITKKINAAAEAMNIRVLDHIIISKSDFYSFKEHRII